MTITEALKKYKQMEADLLLGHVLKQDKEFLYLHPNKVLTKTQELNFEQLAKQRLKGMPIAYLLGYKYFYGLKFKVTKDTLIPRPESEWLVENSLRIINAKLKRPGVKGLKILDVGTGSGCLAISIRKQFPGSKIKVTAMDISSKALAIAKANAKTQKVQIKFIKSDLLKNVTGKYDLIIANLPYVPIRDYRKFYPNLKHEPKLALTDGSSDFKLIDKFLKQVSKHLEQRAVILLEVDPKFFKQRKDMNWRVVKDIRGLDRFALMANYKK